MMLHRIQSIFVSFLFLRWRPFLHFLPFIVVDDDNSNGQLARKKPLKVFVVLPLSPSSLVVVVVVMVMMMPRNGNCVCCAAAAATSAANKREK